MQLGRFQSPAGRKAVALFVAELWRYPVKSMAGELLQAADLGENGVAGDRVIEVINAHGRIVSSRTRPKLLMHHAVLTAAGDVLVDGRPWDSPEVARDVKEAAGPDARLVRSEGMERFDILPLLIATDGMIAAVGRDRRRFRPNILIGGVPGLTEREWEGGQMKIGEVVIGMRDLRARCVMTTFDPDTGVQDLGVLRQVQRDFDGVLGLNSWVIAPGRIAVGDAVEVIPAK